MPVHRTKRSPELEERVIELYTRRKYSMRQVASEIHASQHFVQRILEDKGLNRTKPAAEKLAYNQGRAKSLIHPTGKNHWHWKGGRHVDQHGYILVYCPGHPRANVNRQVREHILVWEEATGQSLPSDWQIHHMNGIRSDNRPENLLALPRKSHNYALRLQAQQKKIRQLEAEVRKLKAQQIMPIG